MNEYHPYNDYSSIPKETRLLIIGTAPPPRFSKPRPADWQPPSEQDVDFFYGSKDNELWKDIFPQIYRDSFPLGEKLSTDKLRSFLKSQGIWMHDICEEYTRNGGGALDEDLVVVKYADLRRIVEEHTTISTLVFTGGRAETLSGRKMEGQQLIPKYQFGADGISKKPIPRHRLLSIAVAQGARKIETFTVPSPSPLARLAYSLELKIDFYRTAICNSSDSMNQKWQNEQ